MREPQKSHSPGLLSGSDKDWTKISYHSQLNVELLQAFYIHHAYPRHSHDYYVICLIEQGVQSFTYGGTKHITPQGGLILLNPGAVHTGEPANERGFKMRSLYPTTDHMQKVAFELTGQHQTLPFFKEVRVDQPLAANTVLALYKALIQGASALECESRFTWTLAQLIKQYADVQFNEQRLGKERKAIRQARHYIEDCFAEGVSLTELAKHVSFSPYYLLRVFCAEVGMPPYAYQESVRIGHAQRLIEAGNPLAQVAVEVGFSSQSHFTHRFKKIIGVTPGQFAQQFK